MTPLQALRESVEDLGAQLAGRGSDADGGSSSNVAVSGRTETVDGMDTYSTRKFCPHCSRPAQRVTEVKQEQITRGFYLCPGGHSWGMHWREP